MGVNSIKLLVVNVYINLLAVLFHTSVSFVFHKPNTSKLRDIHIAFAR